jgi:MFS family permease
VANVALPDIGTALNASQTGLNLVAVSYSLGLAASVLWLGALGDHHGRELMLILGVSLSVPASPLSAGLLLENWWWARSSSSRCPRRHRAGVGRGARARPRARGARAGRQHRRESSRWSRSAPSCSPSTS